jgi:uncharacterized protein (TIGR02391 family)
MTEKLILFSQSQLESISKALGDTDDGLKGGEIEHTLRQVNIPDTDPTLTKWKRLFNAFAAKQNLSQNRTNILQFIRVTMRPEKYIGNSERYETLRSNLNIALSFCGLKVKEDGDLVMCDKVSTLSEAENRANRLKLSLRERDIHPDVLKFCRAELLQNNYFHAVLEAVKSVFDKLRKISNSSEDGHSLVEKCFSGNSSILKINNLTTESERSEQNGFASLIKGVYSMFRTPLAHEAKINWNVDQKDAEDLLTTVSMIHRRIDNSKK